MARMTQAICDDFPAETRVTRPTGGQVLWLKLQTGFDVMRLYEEALKYQVGITTGIMFSLIGNYKNCFHLNCGLPWSNEIERAMQTLGFLSKQQLVNQLLQ
jgi:DNA-binding transcriptional MocR family regulator